MIQIIDPENINVNSKLYRPDHYCAYHSRGAGHTTENCINLKHRIQDLIDQKVITLQTAAPNVNCNPLSNHEGVTINMIEVEEDWYVDKVIIPVNHDGLGKVVASGSISEEPKFVIMAPHQAFALVSKKGQNKKKVNRALPKPLPHMYQSFPVRKRDNDDGLGEGVKNLLKESDVVLIETPDMRDAKP